MNRDVPCPEVLMPIVQSTFGDGAKPGRVVQNLIHAVPCRGGGMGCLRTHSSALHIPQRGTRWYNKSKQALARPGLSRPHECRSV